MRSDAGTAFQALTESSRILWAKSGEGAGHSLLAHMLDVAAVAMAILSRESSATLAWAARQFGLPNDTVAIWLATLAGLHDFGKSIPGFQCKWPEGRFHDEATGLAFPPRLLAYRDHAVASAVLLRPLLQACIPAEARAWVLAVLQALSAHHGYNYLPAEFTRAVPSREPAAWPAARTALFEAYWQTLAPSGQPTKVELPLPAVAWLAGLTSVADWIGSNPDWFPPGERSATLAGHYAAALDRAAQALESIHWPHFSPLLQAPSDTDTLVRRIIAKPDIAARPLQRTGDRFLVTARRPSLLLVEAPMGEGKTELALLAALRLQAANGHRGFYLALPTQATGNAQFDRVLPFLRAFGKHLHLDIQLVHAGARLDERIARLRDVDNGEDDISSSIWFSERRRALISPYGVGTVDQALFAVLNVKHHFVRLWGLANRVVVLDEIHAYDTYTSTLILALLRWLRTLGCSVVLMSATLPRKRRNELLAAWDIDASRVPTLAYPRVIFTDGQDIAGDTFPTRPLAPVEVFGIAEDLDDLTATALECLAKGGCGAVIVNTVARAQQLYQQISAALPTDCTLQLFHARYPADQRGELERQVLECYGPAGTRPPRALLIATQVAEQSLDLDFDFLISDLAPIDLLLQRVGRLHRHDRERPPGHAQARFFVAGLRSGNFPELKTTAWGYVYEPYILARTWALIADETRWQLPEDIDRLVQKVYDDDVEPPATIDTMICRHIEEYDFGEHCARWQLEKQDAENAAIDADAEPANAYDNKPRGHEEEKGLGIRNSTRRGEHSLAAIPLFVSEAGWSLHPGAPAFDPQAPIPDELAQRLYARQLRLNRKAICAELLRTAPPKGFMAQPLLRDMFPLCLDAAGRVALGDFHLRLDPLLGLIFETTTETTTPPTEDAQ